MAWDASVTRRRQNSSTSKPLAHRPSQSISSPLTSSLTTSPNPHLTDPLLQPFSSPTFDPAAYLNAQLPPLKPRTSSTSTNPGSRSSTPSNKEATLADLSASTQTLLSQLSAHTSRLTTTLTELTDAILRGGARLAYEVEVLHGETQGLQEALRETLKDDIEVFVHGGIEKELERPPVTVRARSNTIAVASDSQGTITNGDAKHTDGVNGEAKKDEVEEPEYIKELKKLTAVREKLDTVIKTFDSALSWTFPPSEVSVSSSLISVAAPEPGSEAASVEEKGQAVSKKLRSEVMDMLTGGNNGTDGIAKARARIAELRGLCDVWKGTAEEKSRLRFIDGLQKMIDDKEREIERRGSMDNKTEQMQAQPQPQQQSTSNLGGYGFINHLQKMRGGI